MKDDIYIKNDANIMVGTNIKRMRIEKSMKPSDLVREANLKGVNLTVFSLSKIEANTQHIRASQLRAIKEILGCQYEDLLEKE